MCVEQKSTQRTSPPSPASQGDAPLWRITLDEIYGLEALKCRVDFFDGSNGKQLGSSGWSSSLLEHSDTTRHVLLLPPTDSKTPVVAKILSDQPRSTTMKLCVQVIAGRHLKAMDRGGTSDPYVRICVGKNKEKRARSRTIQKSLDPVWNEELEVDISSAEMAQDELHVQVYDQDLMSDDLIGDMVLQLSTLPSEAAASRWYTIFDDSHGATGELELALCLTPAAPTNEELPSPPPPRLCLVVFVDRATDLFAADAGGTSGMPN
jgi:hypothetical protein